MDTSETYIKMCDCEEIQKQWVERGTDSWNYNLDGTRTWLPRQDQLQEMVCKDWGLQTICTRLEEFSKASDGGVSITIDGSMEQLWLAFVMKEKYNKVWDGSSWIFT